LSAPVSTISPLLHTHILSIYNQWCMMLGMYCVYQLFIVTTWDNVSVTNVWQKDYSHTFL
jgi:hypothetical protein